jgi:hypothetical protein
MTRHSILQIIRNYKEGIDDWGTVLITVEQREKALLQQAHVMQGQSPDPLAVVDYVQKLKNDMQNVLDSGDVCSRSGKSYSTGFIAALDRVLGFVSSTANGA